MLSGLPQKGKLFLRQHSAFKGTHNTGPTFLTLALPVVAENYPQWAELHFPGKDITSYDL